VIPRSFVTYPGVVACTLFMVLASLPAAVPAQTGQEAAPPAAPSVPPANPLKTQDELQAAYQKEYAFLEAQLREL